MKPALIVLACMMALPAGAQTFKPPVGCDGYMTVQSHGCRVSNFYRCTADAPGDQWRADFDQEGIFFLSKIDREGQWIESLEMPGPVTQTLDPNPKDPASFSDLLAGKDNYAFDLTKDNGEASTVTGFDKLTGRSFVIDGITLKETQFDYTETDRAGALLRKARGHEYISEEYRTFFAGPSEWDDGNGGWVPVDGSPVAFIFPGEPGYLTTQPIFDCDAILSSLPQSRKPTEAQSHDDL